MNKFISILKVAGCLILSYIVVIILTEVFFVGNSPLIRTRPDRHIAKQLKLQWNQLLAIFNVETESIPVTDISTSDFQQFLSNANSSNMLSVAPGTYAATIKGEDVRIVKLDEIPTNNTTYQTSKGAVKVRVLKGSKTPSQSEVEEMIK